MEDRADGSGVTPQLVPDTLAPLDQGDPTTWCDWAAAGAPGFTFAPRLVLIREVLRACACHQLHIHGAVHLGSRGVTGSGGLRACSPHSASPTRGPSPVLGTDESSLPTVEEMAGAKPWEVTNDKKMVCFRLSNLGGGPVLWVTSTCQQGAGWWGPTEFPGLRRLPEPTGSSVSPSVWVDEEKEWSPGPCPTPAPTTSLSCLGLVAANGFHLLRPPAPDTTFVPETDQTGVHEAPHPPTLAKAFPSKDSLQSASYCETRRDLEEAAWTAGTTEQGLGTGKYRGITVHFVRSDDSVGLGLKTSFCVRVRCTGTYC